MIEQSPIKAGLAASNPSSTIGRTNTELAGRQNGNDSVAVLPATGERLVPGGLADPLFRQHEARYVFAGKFVQGRRILDVACGSGMGTKYLSSAGASATIGLDIDAEAISFAKKLYRECEFGQCDVTKLCIANASVDVVVSFETIEHIEAQSTFLNECHRVLKPGGVLICSTPNLTLSKWGPGNPFHVRELTVKEFGDVVASVFQDVRLFSQNRVTYPVWLLRTFLISTLERLHLAGPIRELLQISGKRSIRSGAEFRSNSSDIAGIEPCRDSFLIQPTFVIAVAKKG
ncbi:MAG TPA: class I SAM-dependent methyltransferase [Terriglobales bacterium]|nr:class I SAM-dependent methyltransferase [Terriglobales bacterium]